MAKRAKYMYACIDKETRCCTAAMYAPYPREDDELFEFFRVYTDPQEYLDKYYIGGFWYEREFTYDSEGNITGYTDTLWNPAG